MESRENRKKLRGMKRLTSSLSYAKEGILYAYKNEQSLTIHAIITALVLIAGIIFKISLIEWMIVIFCIGLVLAFELVNTSIEAVVDLATSEIKPLAKVAKDVAAGVSVVFSITTIIIGIMIFLPKVIEIFKGV